MGWVLHTVPGHAAGQGGNRPLAYPLAYPSAPNCVPHEPSRRAGLPADTGYGPMNPRTAKAVWDHWAAGRSTNEIARRMKGRKEPEIDRIINDLLQTKFEGRTMPWDEPKKPSKVVIELPKRISA